MEFLNRIQMFFLSQISTKMCHKIQIECIQIIQQNNFKQQSKTQLRKHLGSQSIIKASKILTTVCGVFVILLNHTTLQALPY